MCKSYAFQPPPRGGRTACHLQAKSPPSGLFHQFCHWAVYALRGYDNPSYVFSQRGVTTISLNTTFHPVQIYPFIQLIDYKLPCVMKPFSSRNMDILEYGIYSTCTRFYRCGLRQMVCVCTPRSPSPPDPLLFIFTV